MGLTSGIMCLVVLIGRYMVTPQARRSFTLSTEDTTSLEKSSNTSTFQIGSPVSDRMGELAGCTALFASSSSGCLGALRFRIRWMEAIWRSRSVAMVVECGEYSWRPPDAGYVMQSRLFLCFFLSAIRSVEK
jgi:hypothetical protein